MLNSRLNPLRLTRVEQDEVTLAIAHCETITSGEVRVCIEKESTQDTMARAKEVFFILKMNQTKDANGVLIYINATAKKYAIIGDKGFDQKVPWFYWDSLSQDLGRYFSLQQFAQGLTYVINRIGKDLSAIYPYSIDDKNELPDEIHYL